MPRDRLSGVICCLSAVLPDDLRHLRGVDRIYGAAETTAFLTAWLAHLTVPVVNAPRHGSLSGPSWPPERWAILAARLGVPVAPLHRDTQGIYSGRASVGVVEVVVVSSWVTPQVDPMLGGWTRALAQAADCVYLSVRFERLDHGWQVVDVSAVPRLDNPLVAQALLGAVGVKR